MRLYIVRHGIAGQHGTPGVRDDDRTLTKEGKKKMQEAAAGLRILGYVPNLILSSPLPRAGQTAEILREEFGNSVILKICPALAPSGTRQELYREIMLHERNVKSLMLVGHQPFLGEIAGEIAWGSAEHYVELKKGGICVIDLEGGRDVPKGTLVSLMPPSILRQLAGVR